MIETGFIEIALKILLAAVLGMVVGAEREHRRKAAGLRTYTLVSIGSVLFTILSLYGFSDVAGKSYDPGRIAGQIVVGIGFIGAGLIFFKDNKLQGLTTATGIWVTAAIGMAVGLGLYATAIFVTILTAVVMGLLTFLEEKISSLPDDPVRSRDRFVE